MNDLYEFWFGEVAESADYLKQRLPFWFIKNEKTDTIIIEKFAPLLADSPAENSAASSIENIVLYDQSPRNSFRGSSKAFQYDSIALRLSKQLVADRQDIKMNFAERIFVYLPFEHSENIEDQLESVRLFKSLKESSSFAPEQMELLYDFALKHKTVIERFGRYPHRNLALGRISTREELNFLQQPGSSF